MSCARNIVKISTSMTFTYIHSSNNIYNCCFKCRHRAYDPERVIKVGDSIIKPFTPDEKTRDILNSNGLKAFTDVYRLSDDQYNIIKANTRAWRNSNFCGVCRIAYLTVLVRTPSGNFILKLDSVWYKINEMIASPSSFDIDIISYCASTTNANGMFRGYKNLTTLDVTYLSTNEVTSMREMFEGCSQLKNLILGKFDTRKVVDMDSMFSGCKSLINLDVSSFDTKNVTNMRAMFADCSSLERLDLSGFNTEKVSYMGGMFRGCSNLTNLILPDMFKSLRVEDMSNMFAECKNLRELDLSKFKTKNVESMEKMFYKCESLKKLDLSGCYFNKEKLISVQGMFEDCKSLEELNLGGFKTSNIIQCTNMFKNCKELKAVYIDESNDIILSELNKIDQSKEKQFIYVELDGERGYYRKDYAENDENKSKIRLLPKES